MYRSAFYLALLHLFNSERNSYEIDLEMIRCEAV